MKEELIIVDYLRKLKNAPLGCSDLVFIIESINQKEKIVCELLDFKYEDIKNNMLSFFDSALGCLVDIRQNSYEEIEQAIILVLTTFNNLENKEKWKISGTEFRKLVKEKWSERK